MHLTAYADLHDSMGSISWFRESFPQAYRVLRILLFIGGLVMAGGGIYYQDIFFSMEGLLVSFSVWELHRSSMGYPSIQSTVFPRFIEVNEKGITYKNIGYREADFYSWREIQEVKVQFTALILTIDSSIESKISLSEVDYKELRAIKEVTQAFAKQHHIPYH